MRPTFDDKDAEILKHREQLWNQVEGPRVGDFCQMPDGSLRRFTYKWFDDKIQLTVPSSCFGSFYFGNGYADYSGALDPGISIHDLIDTGEKRKGKFWFFHNDFAAAYNGVEFEINCRVYRYEPKGSESE